MASAMVLRTSGGEFWAVIGGRRSQGDLVVILTGIPKPIQKNIVGAV
jgi:hypothetical protein